VEIAYSGSAIDARWHGTDRTCREVRPKQGTRRGDHVRYLL
jgi:hypothetical protein